MTLILASKVMDKTSETEIDVTFECLGPERSFGLCVFPRDEWEDMGEPETITIEIEPGDRLNGE